MLKFFLLQVILNLTAFVIWVSQTDFSGGEVGMTPYLVLTVGLIQLGLGSALYILTNLKTKVNPLIAFLLLLLLYELIFYLFTGNFSLKNAFDQGTEGLIYKGYSFCSLITGFPIFTFILICTIRNRKP